MSWPHCSPGWSSSRRGATCRRGEMLPVTTAGAVGAFVGVYVLVFLSQSTPRIAITVLILLLTLSLGLRVPWPQTPPRITGPAVGFVVGVLLASLAVGGPLLVLLMVARKWARQTIRASMSFYFLIVHGLAVAGLRGRRDFHDRYCGAHSDRDAGRDCGVRHSHSPCASDERDGVPARRPGGDNGREPDGPRARAAGP